MRTTEERQIKEILLRDNTGFKNLNLQHQECERKLQEINTRILTIRTDKEWIEEHDLKKQKLKLKDSMQRYILEYRKQASI
ncbi:MAG: DUF465 domain-containing protein [bacterium]|nr:DUF465 domain-containing protein [bacterium]